MSKNRSKQDIIRYRIEQQKQAVKNSAYFAAPMSVPEMDYFAKTRIFQASRKYIVDSMDIQNPQDRETSDLQLRSALTIDRNLRGAYGIGLDAELLRTFAAASMESQAIAYQELDRLIRDRLGIDESQQSHLFYPGFPEEVMGKNDVELYLNAIIYYGARYGADIMGFASVMQEYGIPDLLVATQCRFRKATTTGNESKEQDCSRLVKSGIRAISVAGRTIWGHTVRWNIMRLAGGLAKVGRMILKKCFRILAKYGPTDTSISRSSMYMTSISVLPMNGCFAQ